MAYARRLWAAAMLAAFSLSSCRPATAAAPAPTHPPATPPQASPTAEQLQAPGDSLSGRVVVWMDWPPAETHWLSGLLSQFGERHQGVQVSLRYIPRAEFHAKLLSQALLADGPTILLGPSAWATELYDAGVTQEVTERISPELRASLTPIAWSQAEDGQQMLGVPIELQGMVLYRNPAILPEAAPSLEEMEQRSAALSSRRGLVLDLGMRTSMPFMSACGGTLMLVNSRIQVDEAVGTCWLKLLQRMAGMGTIGSEPDADLQAFLAGDTAWLVDSVEHLPRIEQALGQTPVIDDWPVYGETGKPLSGYTWALNAYLRSGLGVEDAEASWAFIQFLLSPEAQLDYSRIAGAAHLPVLAEAWELSEEMAQAREILTNNTPYPLARGLAEFTTPLERAARLVARQSGEPVSAWRRAMETLRVQPTASSP